MLLYIIVVACVVFFLLFRNAKKSAARTAGKFRTSQSKEQIQAELREASFNESTPRARTKTDSVSMPSDSTATPDTNKSFEESTMLERAETHVAENSMLGGIVSPSPIELEKQVDFARPLMQPISNSTSLFDADKVDDLTRPWGQQVASEPTNLFELDKKHDLTKPWGES